MTERNEPVDARHEEALAAALQAHAETVRPAGDGLIRIRARVERRRMRTRFLVPIASTAAVAATVTAVVATGLLAGPSHKPSVTSLGTTTPPAPAPTTTTKPPAPTTTAAKATVHPLVSAPVSTTPVTTATTAVASVTTTPSTRIAANVPSGPVPVWPFADQAAADAWQKTAATSPDQWHLDARATAERFVASVVAQLQLPKQGVLNGTTRLNGDDSATVDVTRDTGSTTITLGTVRLSRWSTGAAAPWGVVDVTSPAGSKFPLEITSPTTEARVASPLPVRVTMFGAENDDYVSVITAGGGSTSPVQHAVWGSGGTATVSGVPTNGRGYVVVADGSTAQGPFGLSRLAVTPVEFGPPFNPLPTYVAVVNGTLHVFDTTTNAEVGQLAVGTKGITQVIVGADRQSVYYLAPSGFMVTQLIGSRQSSTETTADGMHKITGISISGPHDERLAYLSTSPAGDGQWIYWSAGSGRSGQIEVSKSLPPVAESLAISPDGTQLSAFVRNGTHGNVMTFDLATAKNLADGTSPKSCTADGSECIGEAYAPNGDLLTVTSDGTKFVVYRQHGSTSTRLFSVAGVGQGASLDTDPTGTKILLADGLGHAWSWSGSGKAKALPGQVLDASW